MKPLDITEPADDILRPKPWWRSAVALYIHRTFYRSAVLCCNRPQLTQSRRYIFIDAYSSTAWSYWSAKETILSIAQTINFITEAQFLLMAYVFDELGYRRYEWRCVSLKCTFMKSGHKAWYYVWRNFSKTRKIKQTFGGDGQKIRKLEEIRKEIEQNTNMMFALNILNCALFYIFRWKL